MESDATMKTEHTISLMPGLTKLKEHSSAWAATTSGTAAKKNESADHRGIRGK
jgi:hypothetical protein